MAGDKNGMDLFTRDMLTWILPKLCEDKANLLSKRQDQQNEKPANTTSCGLSNANIIQVGRALREMPPNIVSGVDLSGLAPVLTAVIEVANMGKSLPSAVKRLGWLDTATLVQFCLDRSIQRIHRRS